MVLTYEFGHGITRLRMAIFDIVHKIEIESALFEILHSAN